MDFSFAHPQYLFLLFLVPLMFFMHFWSLGSRKRKALKFANFDAIAKIEGIDFFSKNLIILFLNVLIITSLVFSVSGLNAHTTMKSSFFSFAIAIDSSQSMEADDLKPDRISVAKETATSFIDTLPLDVKVGIISFSGGSKIEKDMTFNKDELKRAINGINVGGFGGTDLYEAVLTSSNLLKNEKNKAVILLSDGQINVGNLDDAVDYANDNNVLIHTVGLGTKEGGKTDYGISKIDEDSLKSLAYNTKGTYFNAESKENLTRFFAGVLSLTERRVTILLSDYLIFFAVLFVAVEFFLSNTRYISLI